MSCRRPAASEAGGENHSTAETAGHGYDLSFLAVRAGSPEVVEHRRGRVSSGSEIPSRLLCMWQEDLPARADPARAWLLTPHGLRGSDATVDVVDEVVSRVSKQLGHAGTAVTLGHYLDGDTMDQLWRLLACSQTGPSNRRRDPPETQSPEIIGASECGRGESNSHSITATRT